jgi:hypothetical protein
MIPQDVTCAYTSAEHIFLQKKKSEVQSIEKMEERWDYSSYLSLLTSKYPISWKTSNNAGSKFEELKFGG